MWRKNIRKLQEESSLTWNGCNRQENISKSYLRTSQSRLSNISCTMGTPSFLVSKIYLRTGKTRLSTISCTIGTPSVLISKIYLLTGQTRLSMISCTVVTPSFWWEHNILRCFPALRFEVDPLIISGITETTEIFFLLLAYLWYDFVKFYPPTTFFS